MLYMNAWDIQVAAERYANHPTLGPATQFLEAFVDEVNSNSDGWAHWSPPVRAARQLIMLIQRGDKTTTMRDVERAIIPIKAFITRCGSPNGIKLPPLTKAQHVVASMRTR